MKIRSGFVSNSSSCSFLFMYKEGEKPDRDKLYSVIKLTEVVDYLLKNIEDNMIKIDYTSEDFIETINEYNLWGYDIKFTEHFLKDYDRMSIVRFWDDCGDDYDEILMYNILPNKPDICTQIEFR